MYKKIMKLWHEGKTSKEIESILGIKENIIMTYIRNGRCPKSMLKNSNVGLKMCQRGRKSSIDHKMFVELWKSGMPIAEMAEKLGTTPATINTYACRHRDECPRRRK